MSDEIKQENEEQEHDVEAHRRHHGHVSANDEPTAQGEDSDDAVEAHMKHHHKA